MTELNNLLENIKNIQVNIGNAIENKGQTVTNFASYPNAILNIPSGSGSGDVKLFDTVERMQQDTTAQEGDLALVYKNEIQPITEESEFDSCTFPQTVVLKEAFTDNIYGRFSAVDSSSGMFDGDVDMSSSNFRFNGFGDTMVRVEYTSSDGITYTRTDGGEELQEFGTTVKWENYEPFNNVIGNFMKIGGNYFDGLYKYELDYPHTDIFVPVSGFTYIDNNIKPINTNLQVNITNTELFNKAIQASKDYESITSSTNLGIIFCDNDFSHIYIYTVNKFNMTFDTILFDRNDVLYFTVGAYKGQTITDTITGYDYDINSETVSPITLNQIPYSTSTSDYIAYSGILGNLIGEYYDNKFRYMNISYREDITDGTNIKILERFVNVLKTNEYVVTKSQLNATSDYVYEKTFYGKNGVESGTLGTPDNSFADANAEVYNKIQNQYENMEPRVLTDSDKTIAKNIYFIPVKKDGTPLLDTSKVTDMSYMFHNCTNLTAIPLLDTSNATDMQWMFEGCSNLTAIPELNTSKVTNMAEMFDGCTNLTVIPLLNTSKVTDMSYMIANTNVTAIPLLDTSNATNMHAMFTNCSNLTTIPELKTSKVTNMESMFGGCSNLTTIPLLDTSNVTNMQWMFEGCSNLTAIPELNTSKVTNMFRIFLNCSNLTTIPLLNTSKVTNMAEMFYKCSNLSDDSLNIIMQMCINATSYTGTKTLKKLDLTSEQADKCKTLSNYSAFTSAGWTTGY